MAKERGLIKKIAEKYGWDISTTKRKLMRTAVEAAKELLRRAGITGKPGIAWFVALKAVLPVFWEIVREKDDIPSVEEVVSRVLAKYPDITERLKAAHAIAIPSV